MIQLFRMDNLQWSCLSMYLLHGWSRGEDLGTFINDRMERRTVA